MLEELGNKGQVTEWLRRWDWKTANENARLFKQ